MTFKQTLEQFEQQAVKHDQGKLDWSLLPWDAVEETIRVLEFGAGKYSPWNWAEGEGFKYTRLFNSSMRHFVAWFWRKEDLDPETGISHIAHLSCNVLFLLHYVLNKNKFKSNDNRPNLQQAEPAVTEVKKATKSGVQGIGDNSNFYNH